VNAEVKMLDWDTAFFGFPVARLTASRPDAEAIARVNTACRAQRVRCLYALVDAGDADVLRRLESDGYRFADVRVTLRQSPRGEAPLSAQTCRRAGAGDVAALREIAAMSHTDSRYFRDPGFDRARCAELYATWIEKSVGGYEDAVWVAEHEGRVAGYITCARKPEGIGQIGLFAVAGEAQGRGLGTALVRQALAWFLAEGCAPVDVVTQGCNARAQQVYQRAGFVTARTEIWMHKWF
jgi:ribosomal protein S18 acetylase RimI-like enzyme